MAILTEFKFTPSPAVAYPGEFTNKKYEVVWEKTPATKSDAIFSDITISSSDTSIVTAQKQTGSSYYHEDTRMLGGYAYIKITGVAVGSATVTASYTDDNDVVQTATLSVAVKDHTLVIVNEDSLEDIADSIRSMRGVQDTYKPGEMAAAIKNIPTGVPRYIATGGWGSGDGFYVPYDRLPVFSLPDNITDIGDYSLAYAFACDSSSSRAQMQSVDLKNIEYIGSYGLYHAFENEKQLTSIDLSSVQLVNAYGMERAFAYCDNLAGAIDLSSLTFLGASNAMCGAFTACKKITSVDLSSLVTTSNFSVLESAFSYCTLLASIDFSSLEQAWYQCFKSTFAYCTSLAQVEFPALDDMGYGAFSTTFDSCASLVSASFPALVTMNGNNSFQSTFKNCTSFTTFDVPHLEKTAPGTFSSTFDSCTALTTMSFPALTWAYGNQAFSNTFKNCSSLTSVSFPELEKIEATSTTGNVFYYTFSGCSSLQSVSFPSLTTLLPASNRGLFYYMLSGCTGVTLHFPAAVQSSIESMNGYPNFGGTNTTVLFDL